MLVFVERGKLEKQVKNPQGKVKNRQELNPHMMLDLGIKPRPHWWEASTRTTATFVVSHPQMMFLKEG